MTTASREGIPPDDGRIADGDLIRRGREEHSREALALLAGRHLPRLRRIVAGWAWAAKLRGADIEEAQEVADLALYPAVEDFEAEHNCAFQTFLAWKAWGLFLNFVRGRRRLGQHYEQSARAACLVGCGAGAYPAAGTRGGDPVAEVEQQELLDIVAEVLEEQEERARRLWEGRMEGRSLRELAPELGLSDDQAKRRYRKVQAALRERLGDFRP